MRLEASSRSQIAGAGGPADERSLAITEWVEGCRVQLRGVLAERGIERLGAGSLRS